MALYCKCFPANNLYTSSLRCQMNQQMAPLVNVQCHMDSFRDIPKRQSYRVTVHVYPNLPLHQNNSSAWGWGACTKELPLFWCQWKVGNNVNGQAVVYVILIQNATSFSLGLRGAQRRQRHPRYLQHGNRQRRQWHPLHHDARKLFNQVTIWQWNLDLRYHKYKSIPVIDAYFKNLISKRVFVIVAFPTHHRDPIPGLPGTDSRLIRLRHESQASTDIEIP